MKEAERKYRESLGNPEREGEKEISTNIQEQNIQVILMLIFIIILFVLFCTNFINSFNRGLVLYSRYINA